MSLIGEEITRARKANGMTSKQLADVACFSQQFIGDIQHGRRIPSMETTLAIAQALTVADTGRWAWLVIRDTYGDEIFDVLWNHASAAQSVIP